MIQDQTLTHQAFDAWIALEAVDKAANIARGYHLDVSRDLFGHWVVTRRWGRIGAKSQAATLSFDTERARDHFLRNILRRRASAKRRLGTAYKPVGTSDGAWGFFGPLLLA